MQKTTKQKLIQRAAQHLLNEGITPENFTIPLAKEALIETWLFEIVVNNRYSVIAKMQEIQEENGKR